MANFVSPNQIQIQMGLDLLVRPDTRDDPSQPWEDQSDQNHHGKGGCLEERNEKPEPNIGNGQCCVPTAPARAHKERHREQNWNPAKTGGNKFVIICMLFGATVARYYQASPVSCTYSHYCRARPTLLITDIVLGLKVKIGFLYISQESKRRDLGQMIKIPS